MKGLRSPRLDGPDAVLSQFRLRFIVRHLKQGGLIACPTEGVYGLCCDPFRRESVARLVAVKGRSWAKGFILMAAAYPQVEPLLAPLAEPLKSRMLAHWPGPSTFIVPANPTVPAWLRGQHTGLAVRVTAHPVAARICHAVNGPLISTSANRSGHPPARNAVRLQMFLKQHPDILRVPGALGGLGKPTPIYAALTGHRLR